MKSKVSYVIVAFLGLTSALGFQNCSNVQFQEAPASKLGVCNGLSCELTPLTPKPAVTTILLAIGDEANDQLVIKGASSQLIAETVVRYSSPALNPKILIVRDSNSGGEDPEDALYVESLLRRYDAGDNVKVLEEPSTGLTDADVAGFDLIWFNNPGHPMGSVHTRDVLLRFKGGVVLQGDDLSRGVDFDLTDLTGLRYIDNGAAITCGSETYKTDNNAEDQFNITLDSAKIPGADDSTIRFSYGNDIDLTEVVRSDLEVLAYAVGAPTDCTEQRPAIVRYLK